MSSSVRILAAAVQRSVDLLIDAAVEVDDAVSWPTWGLGADGQSRERRTGLSSIRDGDAGIAWALSHLAHSELITEASRRDCARLARAGAQSVAGRQTRGDGWLSGRPGVVAALNDLLGADSGLDLSAEVNPANLSADLTDGAAGTLLASTRLPGQTAPVALLARLGRLSRVEMWGRSWPGPQGRSLCGLSQGASGIVLALVEAAARWPVLAEDALMLAHEGLAWESSWFDPAAGGWPDLTAEEPSWPARWCHGAAGAGVVRARLLTLTEEGLQVPWSPASVRAELEAAVQICGAEVSECLDQMRGLRVPMLAGGLTLCHGLGGSLGLLDIATDVLGESAHRELALRAATAFVEAAGDDPRRWPTGVPGTDSDLSLVNGISGTAMMLSGLTSPDPERATTLLPGLGPAVPTPQRTPAPQDAPAEGRSDTSGASTGAGAGRLLADRAR